MLEETAAGGYEEGSGRLSVGPGGLDGVEECEEVFTPSLVAALAERLRASPNIVRDRHLETAGGDLSRAMRSSGSVSEWILGTRSSGKDGKDWKHETEDDEAAAYPATFLGSEAVSWMASSAFFLRAKRIVSA
jgi:hypothetical protein